MKDFFKNNVNFWNIFNDGLPKESKIRLCFLKSLLKMNDYKERINACSLYICIFSCSIWCYSDTFGGNCYHRMKLLSRTHLVKQVKILGLSFCEKRSEKSLISCSSVYMYSR